MRVLGLHNPATPISETEGFLNLADLFRDGQDVSKMRRALLGHDCIYSLRVGFGFLDRTFASCCGRVFTASDELFLELFHRLACLFHEAHVSFLSGGGELLLRENEQAALRAGFKRTLAFVKCCSERSRAEDHKASGYFRDSMRFGDIYPWPVEEVDDSFLQDIRRYDVFSLLGSSDSGLDSVRFRFRSRYWE